MTYFFSFYDGESMRVIIKFISSKEVGFSVSIIAGISIGIIVDDTVHFLSKYLRARREENMSSEDAVRYAFANVGKTLLSTSIVLTVGFGILALSLFKVNVEMGVLTAITIVCALIADFLLLPTLLIQFDKKQYASANTA